MASDVDRLDSLFFLAYNNITMARLDQANKFEYIYFPNEYFLLPFLFHQNHKLYLLLI